MVDVGAIVPANIVLPVASIILQTTDMLRFPMPGFRLFFTCITHVFTVLPGFTVILHDPQPSYRWYMTLCG
jgi:hypothetical protein